MLALPLSAQVQQGYVKTLGRPGVPGKPLQGVTVRVRGVMNALVSDANGSFKIQATGKKDGDAIIINSVRKNGYELKDKDIVGRNIVFSSRVPIQLVMVSSAQHNCKNWRLAMRTIWLLWEIWLRDMRSPTTTISTPSMLR